MNNLERLQRYAKAIADAESDSVIPTFEELAAAAMAVADEEIRAALEAEAEDLEHRAEAIMPADALSEIPDATIAYAYCFVAQGLRHHAEAKKAPPHP